MKENHCVISPMKTSSPIDRLKRIFTFRESSPKSNKKEKKKQKKIERTVRWQEDENAVRAGTCIFHVKVKYPEYSFDLKPIAKILVSRMY